MSLNTSRARELLKAFDLRSLFVEELGWDRHSATLEVMVDGRSCVLQAIAHKRGMVAYRCLTPVGECLPPYPVRRKIERQVAKTTHEHLIVFTDARQTVQVWQWVKREPGKPTACREHTFHREQTGEALLQKLEAVAFALSEEESLTLTDVTRRARAGFDVEHVTRRFYEQFRKEHAAFLKLIAGIGDAGDCEWYASVMLNRLMFIYFIQRKGFLNGERDYLRRRLQQVQAERGENQFYSFYRYFLLRLFHEGLGSKVRTPELEHLLGHIPYLDGGLFEVHTIEQRYGEIEIPDRAFARIFDYFDQYQWHLDERPLRADNEINPDVLGYIFEKYINQKQMGAYYTKEDITEYIGKNTILPFLFDAARAQCRIAFENANGPTVWDLLQQDPDRYLYAAVKHGVIGADGAVVPESDLPDFVQAGMHDPRARMFDRRYNLEQAAAGDPLRLVTETWREYVERRQRCLDTRRRLQQGAVREINDLITLNLDMRQFAQDAIESCEGPELLRAFWHAIAGSSEAPGITILDPTCGSGAFLFAALNILEPLYEACLERMEALLGDLERSGEKHRPEKYADLRRVLERVAAHPSRRYFVLKSIILNNLYGVDIMEEAVEICRLRLFLKLVAQVEPDAAKENLGIEPLPDIDFNIRCGNTLVGYATLEEAKRAIASKLDFDNTLGRIQEAAEEASSAFYLFRTMQTQHGMDEQDFSAAKATLRARLKALEEQLSRYLAAEYGVRVERKADYARWLQSHQPFHWFVEFYSIMSSGGFDLVIGNPPYVEYRTVHDTYRLPRQQYLSEEAENLYAYCMERSCQLVRRTSRFGMIVPAGALGLDETACLRRALAKSFAKHWCSTYAIRPSKLFDGVDQRLCIYIMTEYGGRDLRLQTTRYQHWNAEERSTLFQRTTYHPSFVHSRLMRIPQIGGVEGERILRKLEAKHIATVAHYYAGGMNGFLLHYHRSPRYWIRAMDFEQYFQSATRSRSIHHFRDLHFADTRYGKLIGAILNSTLFFFWFVCIGNGRNITGTDVSAFPVGQANETLLAKMPRVFDRLMYDYRENSFVRERRDCRFQEFRPSLSKPIIDEIDQVLAKHYGFTDEELDFIINYDIKYRMGRDAVGGDD